MIHRNLTDDILEALSDTPVVMVNGARQTGKSTLVQSITRSEHPARYTTFDNLSTLAAARNDPVGFLKGIQKPVVFDEIQRAPELLQAIKAEVDHKREAGQFLLTASANVLLLPTVSESLAGRMEVLTLHPFSQGELLTTKEHFIDDVFHWSEKPPSCTKPENGNIWNRIITGGYPEIQTRSRPSRRRAWFDAYLKTIIQRDIRDLANIEGLTDLPDLLSLLATRSATLLNFAELSRSIGLPQTTLKRYFAMLEVSFLTCRIPAWHRNLSRRLTKSPRTYLCDTGLMAHLLGLEEKSAVVRPDTKGRLFETFALLEILKQRTWSDKKPGIYHFRTTSGQEVDILLEDRAGSVAAIEVKASATVSKSDLTGIKLLERELGKDFSAGCILYLGSEVIPFAKNIFAVPIDILWS